MLSLHDIVYVGEERHPYKIVRVGFGHYDGEVRIVKINQPYNFSEGRWVHASECYPLEPLDRLEVMLDVIDSSENRNVISAGTIRKYIGMDGDGDIIIQIGRRKRGIFCPGPGFFFLALKGIAMNMVRLGTSTRLAFLIVTSTQNFGWLLHRYSWYRCSSGEISVIDAEFWLVATSVLMVQVRQWGSECHRRRISVGCYIALHRYGWYRCSSGEVKEVKVDIII